MGVSDFLREFLTPDDSFTQTLRKLTALFNSFLSFFALAYGGYWCALGFTADKGVTGVAAGAGTAIQGFLTLFLGITMIVNGVVSVRWKHISDDHITLVLWLMMLPVLALPLNIPQFGVRPLLIWLSMIAVTTQSRHAVVQALLSLLLQLLSCYNDAYQYTKDATLLLIPGARLFGPPLEVLGELAGATIVVNSIVAGVYLQGRVYSVTFEQARKGKEARAAVEMSREVVRLLRNYDTEGVDKCLKEYASSAVDPELLESYQAMKENLDLYRPHLPMYLFMKDDDESVISASPSGQPSPQTMSIQPISPPQPPSTPPKGESPGANTQPVPYSPGIDADHRGSGGSRIGSAKPGHRASVVAATYNPAVTYAAAPLVSPRTAALDPTQGGQGQAKRTVSFGMIDYRHVWRPYDVENLQDFVNTIYTNATATYGSIHSLIGDTALITWNATNKVAQPEAKAAKFLSRVASAATKGDYIVSGSVCSGPARCSSITSSTKQSAMLLNVPWLGALQGCFQLAQRYKTIIIDETTFGTATYDVECRAVDVVRYNEAPEPGKLPEPLLLLDGGLSTLPSNASAAAAADTSAATLIYEVVQEIKHNEDEWMYQLQKSSSKTGNVIVTAAMEAAAVGNYGDALSQLSQIEASHNPTDARIWRSPLVQRLVQFCEKQLQPD